MARRLLFSIWIVLLSSSVAAQEVELIVPFDQDQGQLPEGIAVNKRGDLFVSYAPLGTLWRIPAGSTVPDPEPFGTVPGFPGAGELTGFGFLGLAVDAPGNVYGAVHAPMSDANGVWRFDRKTGDASKIPGSEMVALANDVAFDKRGNLYITDSQSGAIWRVPKGGGSAQLWLMDDKLAGTEALGAGVPIGANGIEYDQGVLYVAVLEQFQIVGVPVLADGTAGVPWIVAMLPLDPLVPDAPFPSAPDGLAIDVHGNLYVAALLAQGLLKVDPTDGSVAILAAGDPLDWPSSLAFGTGKGERSTLFGVNFSIGEGFGEPPRAGGPGVFAIDVGIPGNPLP